MKRLWLLRHAKSSWEDPGLPDPDRPLAPRGRRAAELLAAHLAASDVRPGVVLCSSSLRTRQTLAAILPALGDALATVELDGERWLDIDNGTVTALVTPRSLDAGAEA